MKVLGLRLNERGWILMYVFVSSVFRVTRVRGALGEKFLATVTMKQVIGGF